MSVKALLIGIDGATFSVLDPLMERGVMPFLKRFISEGVRANLRSVVPALTPPAWTSLMTGRPPRRHGIFDFFRMESLETRHIRFATSRDVGCETIWSIASRNGLKVTALNFPLMFPAPKIVGHVVPGWVPWRQLRLACSPENLFDRLKAVPGFNPRELAMDIKLEEKATEGCSDTEYEAWVEFHTRREQNWYEIVRYLMQEDPSELTAVLFDGVDKIQHLCWRFIDGDEEGLADWERRVRHLCLQYFRCLDRLIEQICSLAGPEATVVIVSDHGFGPSREVFHVNSWLEKQGYLTWSENAAREPHEDAVLGVGRVARHTYLLDWSRTKAFVTTPTSNGIYITGSHNGDSHKVSNAEYFPFCEKLMTQLNEVRSPLTGRPVIDRIWTREELFSGPYMDLAPDLTLELVDGGLVSILESKQCVTERRAVAGTHRPLGVFMAGGPRIRQVGTISELSILDVAPLLLYSLDLPIPESLEGHLPLEAFDQKTLQERPANLTSRINSPVIDPSRAEPALDPEAEAEIMRRLQDLGYLE